MKKLLLMAAFLFIGFAVHAQSSLSASLISNNQAKDILKDLKSKLEQAEDKAKDASKDLKSAKKDYKEAKDRLKEAEKLADQAKEEAKQAKKAQDAAMDMLDAQDRLKSLKTR